MSAHKDPRTGTWYFVVDLPSPDGRRRQAKRRGFTTKKAALTEERALLAKAAHGTVVDPSQLTVGQYLTGQWLPALEGRDLRAKTLDSYRQIVKTHLVPHLGTVRLQALTTSVIETMLAALAADDKSAKTRRNVHGVLSAALVDALRWKLVSVNAATGAVLPKLEKRPPRVWTKVQTARFLAHVTQDRLAPLWRFIVVTGARRGEALGLRWADVDLEARLVTITSSRVVAVGGVVEGPTKTAAGARTIALDAGTIGLLRRWKAAQTAEHLALGIRPDHGLVFTAETGRALWPHRVTTTFAKLCDELALPRIGVHGLRHSAATFMIGSGKNPKIVSQRLGHANVAITLELYSHVMPGDDQDAVDDYAAALAESVTNL